MRERNIDWLKHHFDMRRLLMEWKLSHHDPMCPNRDWTSDFALHHKHGHFHQEWISPEKHCPNTIWTRNNSIVDEFLDAIRHHHNLCPKETLSSCSSLFIVSLSDRVDACNRIVCNHPSTLRPIAWNFVHGHRLYLSRRSCCTDDPVERYVQHENKEQILNFLHTSTHGMRFPDFLRPRPKDMFDSLRSMSITYFHLIIWKADRERESGWYSSSLQRERVLTITADFKEIFSMCG